MHAISLVAFALLGSAASLSPAPASGGALQNCIAQEAVREDLSGSILVTQQGKTMASFMRGKQGSSTSRSISSRTRFNIGSASKMFTAVAIGQLLDAGKLRLDEPVGTIVAGLTPEASTVTIRQLLTHTSGLGDFFRPKNMDAMIRARTASDILPLIADEKPAFTPGTRFSYSNSGFALLGIVIERLTKETYGRYLQQHIFRPARMTNTGLDPRPISNLAIAMTAGGMQRPSPGNGQLVLIGPDGRPLPAGSRAQAASSNVSLVGPDGRPISPPSPAFLRPAPGATQGYGSPAGGLFSTSVDLDRFARALNSGKLLQPSTFLELTSPQVEAVTAANGKPAKYYGFGFGIADEGGLRWVGHNGGTLGANAEFAIQPEHHWIISVLSNRDPPTATNMMRWIKDLLAKDGGQCPVHE